MSALLLLAFGLAMDAVAAATAHGAASRGRGALAVGTAFGLAQGVMPLIGWSLGLIFTAWIAAVDHWIALVLLTVLGLRMIREGLVSNEGAGSSALAGWSLASAAVATSVDAAAAGVTLPTIGQPVHLSCFVIAAVTAILSFAGVRVGAHAGRRLGKAAEIGGGAMLVLLGLKIFIEHQFFGG